MRPVRRRSPDRRWRFRSAGNACSSRVRRFAASGARRRAARRIGPISRPVGSRASRTTAIQSAGSRVSACRNSSTSPRAVLAPAFICDARPRGASTIRSARGSAASRVPSRLPPSATMISMACPRESCSGSSDCAMVPASSRTGTTTEIMGARVRGDPPPWRISRTPRRRCFPFPQCGRSGGPGSRSVHSRVRPRRVPARGCVASCQAAWGVAACRGSAKTGVTANRGSGSRTSVVGERCREIVLAVLTARQPKPGCAPGPQVSPIPPSPRRQP